MNPVWYVGLLSAIRNDFLWLYQALLAITLVINSNVLAYCQSAAMEEEGRGNDGADCTRAEERPVS